MDVKLFTGNRENYKWVKDEAGEEYLCPKSVIGAEKIVGEEVLGHCIDDTTASVNPRGG